MRAYAEIIAYAYSELRQRSKMERFGKGIMVFNYFCKKLWRVLNNTGFRVCQISPYTSAAQGSEYV